MIYFDNAATTPIDPHVAKKMAAFLNEENAFGNSISTHHYGRQAMQVIRSAEEQVKHFLGIQTGRFMWTSGATESINLALKGLAYADRSRGKHILTSAIEHSAVLNTCQYLEKKGFSVTYLKPQANGLLSLSQIEQALQPDTILISTTHVNNELGVIQDIAAIGELARAKNILFHVDAAQSVGKIPINLNQLPVDLMSFSAHKIYGPKGIGGLYIHPSIQLEPQIHGGEQQQGLRAGTLATHQILGMGEAFFIAQQRIKQDTLHIQELSQHLWKGIQSLSDVCLNVEAAPRIASILNISFLGIPNVNLLSALPDVALSLGSACHAMKLQPSHVLTALNLNQERINSSIRISLGRFNTMSEVEILIENIHRAVNFLRRLD